MSERKNIDKLFQEKLAQPGIAPPALVWNNIAEKLMQKKRKKRLLLFRISSVFSVLTIFGYYSNSYFNTNDAQANRTKQANKEQTTNNSNIIRNQLVENKFSESLRSGVIDSSHHIAANGVIETDKSTKSTAKNGNKIAKKSIPNFRSSRKVDLKSISKEKSVEINAVKNLLEFDTIQIDAVNGLNYLLLRTIPQSNISTVAAMRTFLPKKKALEHWTISALIAPLVFNTQTASRLNLILNENRKENKSSLSYGLSVAYNFNKKINVRTSFHTFSLIQKTSGIGYYLNKSVKNIPLNTNAFALNDYVIANSSKPVVNEPTISVQEIDTLPFPFLKEGIFTQKTRFIEIPIELGYTLLDRQFKIEVIAGFSTFVIINETQNIKGVSNDNVVEISNPKSRFNARSFSANLGIGASYRITPAFYLKLEPIFKYQIETGINSRFFGFYTGVSYRF